MGYVHTKIASPFIIILSNKMKGYNATCLLHFLFTLSQSLSHNHRDCFSQFYTTIHMCITMPSLYKGNTMEKHLRDTQNHGAVNPPLLTKLWLWNYNILQVIFSYIFVTGELSPNPQQMGDPKIFIAPPLDPLKDYRNPPHTPSSSVRF